MPTAIGRRTFLKAGGGAVASAATGGSGPVFSKAALEIAGPVETIAPALAAIPGISAEAGVALKIATNHRCMKDILRFIDELNKENVTPAMLADKCKRMSAGEIIGHTEEVIDPRLKEGSVVWRRNKEGDLRDMVRRLVYHAETLLKEGLSFEDLRRHPELVAGSFVSRHEWEAPNAFALAQEFGSFIETVQSAFGTTSSDEIQRQINTAMEIASNTPDPVLEALHQAHQLRIEENLRREAEAKKAEVKNDIAEMAKRRNQPVTEEARTRTPTTSGKARQAVRQDLSNTFVATGGFAYPVCG